jgi:hypothetical protein
MPAADRDVYPSRAADPEARAADRDDRAGPPRSLDAVREPRASSGPALASSTGASSTGSADRTTGTRGTRPRTAGTGEAGAAPRVVRPAELDARTSLVRHGHERRASHPRHARLDGSLHTSRLLFGVPQTPTPQPNPTARNRRSPRASRDREPADLDDRFHPHSSSVRHARLFPIASAGPGHSPSSRVPPEGPLPTGRCSTTSRPA